MTQRRSFAAALGGTVLGLSLHPAAAEEPGAESTFERIRRTKVIRVAALPGEAPFFFRDLASGAWSGTAVDMARDIAATFDARIDWVETTYAGSVLDLQANKADMAFALQPTPARAVAIGFSRAYYLHPFAYVARQGFAAKTWKDLDRPEVRVATLAGALGDKFTERYAPKASMTAYKAGADAVMAMQSGRADCVIYGIIQALGVASKNPALNNVALLREPFIALPSCIGVRQEPDRRWRDFLDEWVDYNRGTRQIVEWFAQGLARAGVPASAIPPDSLG